MAGFRLWEQIGIEDLLNHLTQAALDEMAQEYGQPSAEFRHRLQRALKRVLNHDMYASPACGTSSLCTPSEEGRAKPWSRQSEAWGLVAQADLELEKQARRGRSRPRS